MLRPSIEIPNPAIAESLAAASYRATDGASDFALPGLSQTGEEEQPSPVCVACWAY